jgi:hypothetical protein
LEDFPSNFSAQHHRDFRAPPFAPQFQPIGQNEEFWTPPRLLPHHVKQATGDLIEDEIGIIRVLNDAVPMRDDALDLAQPVRRSIINASPLGRHRRL